MELVRPIDIVITGRQFFSTADLFFSEKRLEAVQEGELFFPQKEARSIQLSTTGELVASEDSISVSYDETEITGLGTSRTTFVLSDDVVCLSRAGDVKSHLVFEHGKRYQLYSGGNFPISVQCHSLSHNLSAAGGTIDVDYSVEVAGSTVEHNSYSIQVSV